MTNLPEVANNYPAGIYQLEPGDPVEGGEDGFSNRQASQLADRTAWLKAAVERLKKAVINVLDHGAKGDGVTNDTAAFVAADAEALLVGGVVYVPSGTYRVGHCTLLADLEGFGTIRSLDGEANNTFCVTLGGAGQRVTGLTFDGNLSGVGPGDNYTGTRGCRADGATDLTLDQCTFQNSFYPALSATNCERVRLLAPTARNARGAFGDGLYFEACRDVVIVAPTIRDVTRIGIVGEGAVIASNWVKSDRITVLGGSVENAHDASGGQFNAGVWLEHTNSGSVIGIELRNVGSRGVTVAPLADAPGRFLVSGVHVDGAEVGVAVDGLSADVRSEVVVEGNTFRNVTTAPVKLYKLRGALHVRGNHFGAMNLTVNGRGLVVVDTTGAAPTFVTDTLLVAHNTKEASVYDPAAVAADFYVVGLESSGHLPDVRLADNSGLWVFRMNSTVGELRISNMNIGPTVAAAKTLDASHLEWHGVRVGEIIPGLSTALMLPGANPGYRFLATACEVLGVFLNIGGAASALRFSGVRFLSGASMRYDGPGAIHFIDCEGIGTGAGGLFATGALDVAYRLYVSGGRYSGGAGPYFQCNGFAPAEFIVEGPVFDAAAFISGFGPSMPSRYGALGGIGEDRGDANVVLVWGQDAPVQLFATALTADRVVTLDATRAIRGATYRVARSGAGAFFLDVGGLRTLAEAQWCDVTYTGGAWVMVAWGIL